jgi:hypothetical protein
MSDIPFRDPGRRTPAKGVHLSMGGPNWVFLTVCTEKRERCLAQLSVERTLHHIGNIPPRRGSSAIIYSCPTTCICSARRVI